MTASEEQPPGRWRLAAHRDLLTFRAIVRAVNDIVQCPEENVAPPGGSWAFGGFKPAIGESLFGQASHPPTHHQREDASWKASWWQLVRLILRVVNIGEVATIHPLSRAISVEAVRRDSLEGVPQHQETEHVDCEDVGIGQR